MEGNIGKVGHYEITADGKAKVSVTIPDSEIVKASVELDIVAALELAVSKTDNKVDDALVAAVKKAFGR